MSVVALEPKDHPILGVWDELRHWVGWAAQTGPDIGSAVGSGCAAGGAGGASGFVVRRFPVRLSPEFSMLGSMLGRYRIVSTLGQGGMGVVYKARDTSLNRDVAIKVLSPEAVPDPSRRQRLVVEATAASALNHTAIVTVFDIGSDAGVDFIVMELVSGRTLDRLIGPTLSSARALAYATATADAMAKANDAGIVHRDLKPSNVMVTD